MDRVYDYELYDEGSIPSWRAKYVEHSSVGRTPVCGTGGRGFNPHCSTSFIKTFTAIINYMWQFTYLKMSCSKVYSFLLLDWHKCVGPFLFERRKI